MSDLPVRVLKLAATLPQGNETRRKLLTAVAENKAQKAIWHAWDTMAGVEKIREFDSAAGAASYFLSAVQSIDDIYDSSWGQKIAGRLQKRLKSMDRQSRGWRSAYNLWVQGKGINTGRLAQDMRKTLVNIDGIKGDLVDLRKVLRDEYPEYWGEYQRNWKEADDAADKAVKAFEAAIAIVKSGRW